MGVGQECAINYRLIREYSIHWNANEWNGGKNHQDVFWEMWRSVLHSSLSQKGIDLHISLYTMNNRLSEQNSISLYYSVWVTKIFLILRRIFCSSESFNIFSCVYDVTHVHMKIWINKIILEFRVLSAASYRSS